MKFKEPFLLDAILSMAANKILFDEINYNLINEFVIDNSIVKNELLPLPPFARRKE